MMTNFPEPNVKMGEENKQLNTRSCYEQGKESNTFSEQRPRRIEWNGYKLFKPSARTLGVRSKKYFE